MENHTNRPAYEKPRSRRWQFELTDLFFLVAVAAVVLAFFKRHPGAAGGVAGAARAVVESPLRYVAAALLPIGVVAYFGLAYRTSRALLSIMLLVLLVLFWLFLGWLAAGGTIGKLE